MRWLLNVLKSRGFLVGLGFVLLLGLVFVLGAWLEWSTPVRLIAVIAVLLAAMGVLLVSFLRANKAASAIEQSIKMQAQQQKQSSRPDRQDEIEELQNELERAIEMLKQSKLGKRRVRGRAALYAMPWYLFIGPPAAGKTTAITNSGLNFPVGNNAIRGVGGTRNCDWFFSDQAILLDTAGRYMTEHEDTEEWLAFLDILKQHRKERPINGVIVGISMAELAQAGPEEIDWHANNIRQRVDELINRLGIRFPVYLLFTKCDLLHGFVEFFGDMTRGEREQIWGTTLKRDQDEAPNGTIFEHEFDRLHEALTNMRTARLSRSMKREERHKVYVFPLEFASMKENLSMFVERLFQPNPYQESPIFRGFYFTSGTQEGIPLDRVIQAIADQAQLPTTADADAPDPERETKSYFINGVFEDVIIPDQYMVAQTSNTQRRRRFMQAGVGVLAVLLLGLFVLASGQALVRSQVDLGRVHDAAAAAAPVRWDAGVSMASMSQMDELYQELERLEEREENPPWLRLGLYRGGTVLHPARQLYLDRARTFVETNVYPELMRRLNQPASGGRLEGEAREALYEDLKSYLLLTSERERLEEETNRETLHAHLVGLASERAPLLASDEASVALRNQIGAVVDGLRHGDVAPVDGNPQLVSRVRNVIFQPPSVANLYNTIKAQAADELAPFTLEDAVPAHYVNFFNARPEVPGFFTKSGWEGYAQAAIDEESRDPERTEWVMGYSAEDLPASMQNREEVATQLEEMYFNEYAARWQQFLRSVRLRPMGDLRSAARRLEELGNQYDSPLVYVLAHVTEQTQFRNEAVDQLQERVGERVERAGEAQVRNRTGVVGAVSERQSAEEEMHPVDRRFAALHALKATAATSGGADEGLYRALQGLSSVADELNGVVANGDAEAATFAARVLDENGGSLASEVQSIQNALGRIDSDVRETLFEQPVRAAWSTVLASAQSHLNAEWRARVHDPFQARLADAYPFSNNAQPASLMDVEGYFHPQSGAVATFVAEELGSFLGRDGSPKRWEGRGLSVSSTAQRALDDANRIAAGLFNAGTMRIDFELQPEIPEREGNVPSPDAVYINIHGADNAYRMGNYRPWTAFSWPGGAGATVTLSTRQGDVPVVRYDGDWAVFRLLQGAQLQRRSASEYELRLQHDFDGRGRINVKYNLKPRSASGLFDDPQGFFNYRVPDALN